MFMICQRMGLPPISIMGFGLMPVSSERRVPIPPARMTTFILFFPFFHSIYACHHVFQNRKLHALFRLVSSTENNTFSIASVNLSFENSCLTVSYALFTRPVYFSPFSTSPYLLWKI